MTHDDLSIVNNFMCDLANLVAEYSNVLMVDNMKIALLNQDHKNYLGDVVFEPGDSSLLFSSNI